MRARAEQALVYMAHTEHRHSIRYGSGWKFGWVFWQILRWTLMSFCPRMVAVFRALFGKTQDTGTSHPAAPNQQARPYTVIVAVF